MGGSGARVSCSEPPPLDPSFKLSDAMSYRRKTNNNNVFISKTRLAEIGQRHTESSGSTLAEVSKGVVALFREGDLVDGVSQVAVLQQTASILPGVSAVLESLYSGVEPVYHVST